MLEIKNLGVHYGDRTLFEQVDLQLYADHRYGLVGANGAGKSTFLSILSAESTDYTGQLSWPNQISVGILKQDHFRYEEQSLIDTVLQGRPALWQALQLQQQLRQRGDFSEADTAAYAQAELMIEKENGYAAHSEAARILVGLGLGDAQHLQPLKTLSGGYKLRVLMAQLLFSNPDVLLLDEPTNHLDLYAIQWLAGYLLRFRGLLVIVSHDQLFLDEVCSHIMDVDYGRITVYQGNYTAFVSAKAEAQSQKSRELHKQDKLREETQRFIDRFRSKATKASAVQSRIKMLDKLEEIELLPSSRAYPKFAFEAALRSGSIPLKVKGLAKAYGERQVLQNVSFEVERGDHIALIGPNGVGKSTLLKLIMKELSPNQGEIEWGHQAEPAYFPQDYRQILPADKTIYQWLAGFAGDHPDAYVRNLLGRMLFEGDEVHHKLSTLSGGEATRLVFARLIMAQGNILVLDEPTNHLDLESIEMLAQALKAYPGTLVCVSHNRYFVSQIANRILELKADGLQDFRGSYQEFLEQQNTDHLDRNQAGPKSAPVNEKVTQQADYEARKNQQRRLRSLERRIPELETLCQHLEDGLAQNEQALAEAYLGEDPQLQTSLLQQQQSLQKRLEQAFGDWEEAEAEYQELLEA